MDDLRNKLKWLMIIRVTAVTLFLGSFPILGIKYKQHLVLIPKFYVLIATTFFFTLIYALIFNKVNLKASAYIQLMGDIFLITALVTVTEGIESPFVFLYLLAIILAAIMLQRSGALVGASVASILYGTIVDLQYYRIFSFISPSTLPSKTFFYVLTLHIVAFFAVAILGSDAIEAVQKMKKELKEKDSDLIELQAFNENVAQCMSTGLFTTDEKGRITSFNRAAEEITGYKWKEIKGKFYTDIIPEERLKDILHKAEDILPIYRFESEIPHKDGGMITLGINVSHLRDDKGKSKGLIGIFQDLTKIKEMEEVVKKKEKLAMIGELAAGIAHEIRNPLASLSGAMQVLRQELILQDDHTRLMDIALREMDRLNKLVTDFLLYARPMRLERHTININSLIMDAIRLIQSQGKLKERNINVQTQFKEDLLLKVDPHQLSQVFWNLTLNAIHAMPDGGVLTIISRRIYDSRQGGEIIFKDTGAGIPEDLLDKVFLPFFTTKVEGSGLGLAMVHRIIEDHGGYINVKSRPGKGTEFIIFLPER